jgi:hypothetical protein
MKDMKQILLDSFPAGSELLQNWATNGALEAIVVGEDGDLHLEASLDVEDLNYITTEDAGIHPSGKTELTIRWLPNPDQTPGGLIVSMGDAINEGMQLVRLRTAAAPAGAARRRVEISFGTIAWGENSLEVGDAIDFTTSKSYPIDRPVTVKWVLDSDESEQSIHVGEETFGPIALADLSQDVRVSILAQGGPSAPARIERVRGIAVRTTDYCGISGRVANELGRPLSRRIRLLQQGSVVRTVRSLRGDGSFFFPLPPGSEDPGSPFNLQVMGSGPGEDDVFVYGRLPTNTVESEG